MDQQLSESVYVHAFVPSAEEEHDVLSVVMLWRLTRILQLLVSCLIYLTTALLLDIMPSYLPSHYLEPVSLQPTAT